MIWQKSSSGYHSPRMSEGLENTKGFQQLSRALDHIDKSTSQGEKQSVLMHFGHIFRLESIHELKAADFREFLKKSRNKHWSGLSRTPRTVTEDMPRLRSALTVLLDESKSIAERLDEIRPRTEPPLIANVNRALLTAVLQIAYPEKYGVWNETSEAGLKRLRLWPKFENRSSFGQRYDRINKLLGSLSAKLNIDLWTLDKLWWHVADVAAEAKMAAETAEEMAQGIDSDLHIRKAVEDRAMQVAIEHYLGKDYKVDPTKHESEPYDLECVKEQITLHVEVKGTQGSGKTIILTRGEVNM